MYNLTLQLLDMDDKRCMLDINKEKAPPLLKLICFNSTGISKTQNLAIPQREISS